MHEYEKDDSLDDCKKPVNEEFSKSELNLNKKHLVNGTTNFMFEPDFQTKLDNQANLLHSTENQENVIENFYTDYKCPPPSKLATLKTWRTSLGEKTGMVIAKTIQVVPSITNTLKNKVSAAWPGIKTSLAENAYYIFQGSKTVIKASAKPLAIIAGLVAVMGLGYLAIEFFTNTILPAIQEFMKPAPVQPVQPLPPMMEGMRQMADFISSMSYLVGMMMGIMAALKLKAHGEDPRRVPFSAPITMMVMSALLIALPSFLSVGGTTTFSNGQQVTPIVEQQAATPAVVKDVLPQK